MILKRMIDEFVFMRRKICILLFFCLLFTDISLQAQDRAKPRSGEGIASFLLRNKRSPQKHYDAFVELNKAKLGKNKVLKLGVSYVLPPLNSTSTKASSTKTASSETILSKAKKRTQVDEPVFGKQWSDVKVTSNRLAGACFYVISGHGGPDPGAIGKIGKVELHEDEYAYDIALRLARSLMQEGAEVRIIIQDAKDGIRDEPYLSNSKRETCMGDPIPLNQVQRLQQRCDKINALYRKDRKQYKYCRAIFIHVDSRGKGDQTDVFFYHSNRKPDSKRLANNMKNTFESKYGKHQPNRGFTGTVSSRNLYVLSHATPTSVFVELGNIQNAFDQRRFIMSSNRQALGKWLCEGFMKDYKEM